MQNIQDMQNIQNIKPKTGKVVIWSLNKVSTSATIKH